MDKAKDKTATAEALVDTAEIRRRREALTLTMDEAGRAAGQGPERARQWWNDVESGRSRDPQISKLLAVARALQCGLDDLIVPEVRPRPSRRR